MKIKIFTSVFKKAILLLPLYFISNYVIGQCSFTSSDGYTVTISVSPVALVINTSSCNSGGFEYQLKYSYNVSFSSPPPPNLGLYTLQGVIDCGKISINLPINGGSGTVVSDNHAYYSSGTPNCSSATPSNIGCSSVSIHIFAHGIPDQTVNCPFSSSVLPVTFLSFNASLKNNYVDLNWSTASETNNNFFTIEKSADSENWTAIGKVTGNGNATQVNNYTFEDNSLNVGIAYYRIKQTDIDGKFSYSSVISTNFLSNSQIGVFPNPNNGNTINISGVQSTTGWELKLINITSQVLYTTILNSNQIQLPQIPPGVYFIKISNKSSGESNMFKYLKN